jgi:hypothetical protein
MNATSTPSDPDGLDDRLHGAIAEHLTPRTPLAAAQR